MIYVFIYLFVCMLCFLCFSSACARSWIALSFTPLPLGVTQRSVVNCKLMWVCVCMCAAAGTHTYNMAAYVNRAVSMVDGDGTTHMRSATGNGTSAGSSNGTVVTAVTDAPLSHMRTPTDASPLQIFVKAKKKINDIFVDIEDYVGDACCYMECKCNILTYLCCYIYILTVMFYIYI